MSDEFVIEDLRSGRRAAMESGLVRWPLGTPIPNAFDFRNIDISRLRLICRIELEKPEPVAFHASANAEGGEVDFSLQAGYNLLNPGVCLVLVIDYGDLAGRHRVVADFRSGTYGLPPVTFAQAYVLFWSTFAPPIPAQFAQGLGVAGAFTRGSPPAPKHFTYSASGDVANGANLTLPIPPYAAWFDVFANSSIPLAAAAPILRVQEPVSMLRDYTIGQFFPPWGPASLSHNGAGNVFFFQAGSAPAAVTVQFHLEI